MKSHKYDRQSAVWMESVTATALPQPLQAVCLAVIILISIYNGWQYAVG